jgi:hypothetical protein
MDNARAIRILEDKYRRRLLQTIGKPIDNYYHRYMPDGSFEGVIVYFDESIALYPCPRAFTREIIRVVEHFSDIEPLGLFIQEAKAGKFENVLLAYLSTDLTVAYESED